MEETGSSQGERQKGVQRFSAWKVENGSEGCISTSARGLVGVVKSDGPASGDVIAPAKQA